MGLGGTGTTNQGCQLTRGRGVGSGVGMVEGSQSDALRVNILEELPRGKLKFWFPEVARNAYQVIL